MVAKIYMSSNRLVEVTSKLPMVIEQSIPVRFDCFLQQTEEQRKKKKKKL